MKIKEFILNFINFLFDCQDRFYKRKLENSGLKKKSSKIKVTSHETLNFSCELNKEKEKAKEEIRNLAKKNLNEIKNLLIYAEKEGAKTYYIKNASLKLKPIKESVGFIFPKTGLNALYLSFLTRKKISFKTSEMFVFEDEDLKMADVIYNFYKWYFFNKKIEGYFENSSYLVKNIDELEKINFENLNLEQVIDLKQAISADREGMEFVINFIKETSGIKNAYNVLKEGENGASL